MTSTPNGHDLKFWADLGLFHALVEAGSLNGAQQRVGQSQSGLSRRLQAFEHRLGRRLFLRSHCGLTLTRDGIKLYETTRTPFHNLELACRKL